MKLLDVGLGLFRFKEHCSQEKKMGNLLSACCGVKGRKRSPPLLVSTKIKENEDSQLDIGDHDNQSISLTLLIGDEEESETKKSTYSSLKEYRIKMAYQMFLEEEKYLLEEGSECLLSVGCTFRWQGGKGGDPTYKGLNIEVPMTQEFLDTHLSKRLQELDQLPFYREQTMIMILDNYPPWYGHVYSIYPSRPQYAADSIDAPRVLKIFVKIYAWDLKPPPKRSSLQLLRVLPCSVGITRSFKAMSEILNPIIVKMILGTGGVEQKCLDQNLKFFQTNLNESQKRAIKFAMNNPITILQGPPGTGKTYIITEMVKQLLKKDLYPILIVAASNTAVDNIAEKLLPEHKDVMLRIVAASREGKYDQDHQLAQVCLHTKARDKMLPDILALMDRLSDSSSVVTKVEHKAIMKARNPVSEGIIKGSKILLTTTVVAGGAPFKKVVNMPVIIMDEATQSPEYSSLIPLAFPGIKKIFLVGDQKQLSGHAEVPALAVSLFERVIANGTYKPTMMLEVQYRMHPKISKYPRCKIYRGLLKDGITCEERSMKGIPTNPVVFWDTQGKHLEAFAIEVDEEKKKYSYCNLGEVECVKEVLVYLIENKKISRSNIGVIAPYGGQRSVISSVIAKDARINPEKEEIQNEADFHTSISAKAATIHIVSGITVASIDAFQGREKDFIIMSCVRSNSENNIGFLSDERRLNVALTRAKYGLIFIGDVKCLRDGNSFWNDFISYLETKRVVLRSADFVYGK